MSVTLRVSLDGQHLSAAEQKILHDLYLASARVIIPLPIVPSIRLIFRSEPHGTTVEPFLGSASFEALLRISKKRDDAVQLLALLVACAFWVSPRVGIVLQAEGLPLPGDRVDLSYVALVQQKKWASAWYRIAAVPSWFHLPQVEAKLLPALTLANGQLATHYFREFWVQAVDRHVAYGAVTCSVEGDAATLVNFGTVVEGDAPSADTDGNLVFGGRVYFAESSN